MKTSLLTILSSLFSFTSFCQSLNCNTDLNIRTQITTPNVPNAYTCYMEMSRGGGLRWGTGFLIHPRVILSVGHNFAWYPSGDVHQVKVYFGSIDKSNYLIGDTINLEKNKNKFFNSGYWLKPRIEKDFAIIILPDSAIFKKTGGCYKILDTNKLSNVDSINITGSPGDKDLFQMWTSGTKNFQIDSPLIAYDLHTEVRNSGSPIWTKIGNEYYVVGIHSREWGKCNAAVLLTTEVIDEIKAWCKLAGIDL